MNYEQVKPFNQSLGGTTPNMCLANVIKGYGISAKYLDAWTAWQNTQQHASEAPVGLDVPVFFSYTATIDGINKNWGHVGVRLSDGQFWSDGNIYASITAYMANHTPKYVGWGESINGVVIIKQGEDDMVDVNNVNNAFWLAFNRPPTAEETSRYAGKITGPQLDETLLNSPERKAFIAQLNDALNWKNHAVNDLVPQVAALQQEVADGGSDKAKQLAEAIQETINKYQ